MQQQQQQQKQQALHQSQQQQQFIRHINYTGRPIGPNGPGTAILPAVADSAARRRCEAAQVYFVEYYMSLVEYVSERRNRLDDLKHFIADHKAAMAGLSQTEAAEKMSYLRSEINQYQQRETRLLRKRRERMQEHDFNLLVQIGQGGYGQVFLATKIDTGEVVALKKMKKAALLEMGEVTHIMTERDILSMAKSTEWLVKLLYGFQDTDFIYLAMEYVPGGDMRTLLNQNRILRCEIAQFYFAEMAAAVSSLHDLGFSHRDIKPENFLVSGSGHIKLTDFGLSKGAMSNVRMESMRLKFDKLKDQAIVMRTGRERREAHLNSLRRENAVMKYSVVGSPDYMAPECMYASSDVAMTMGTRSGGYKESNGGAKYDHAVDYWSLGCILFEMFSGYAPFAGQSPDEVWLNVCNWRETFQPPYFENVEAQNNFSPYAWDLIQRLITDRSVRIDNLKKLQQHPFLSHMDLFNLHETANPPFKPDLTSETDPRYFDDFEDPKAQKLYREVQEKHELMERRVKEAKERERRKAGKAYDPLADIDWDARAAFVGFTFKHKNYRSA
ncbi:kinase-like protein [Ramicandelaber brevisporus]|nr:kinase-like protein [Ramicandelaber brevisporus]